MASLRVGGELSHVFTVKEAAMPIKTYSPEIMVHSFNDETQIKEELQPIFSIANSVVVGPGLGREKVSGDIVEAIVISFHDKLKDQTDGKKVNLILDADALWFLKESEELRAKLKEIAMRQTVILTPNLIEFKRLWEST